MSNKNRITLCFDALQAQKKKALITFMTAGVPSLRDTEKIILQMLQNGSNIVEIGVPFSDPIAEGGVIQRASKKALDAGTTLDDIFGMVQSLRTKTDAPLLFMMYVNTIFVYGTEKFFSKCSEYGIDGVIVPDLPYEERDELAPAAEKYGILNINLVSPTSDDRIAEIAANSKGFLYCVSSLGVTGERSGFSTDFDAFFQKIYQSVSCPACVGFGISGPEPAKKMATYCDGVIVGSAVVRLADQCAADGDYRPVGEFVASLRGALDK